MGSEIYVGQECPTHRGVRHGGLRYNRDMVRRSGANEVAGRNGEVLLRAAAEGKAEIGRLSVDQYDAMIRDGIVPEDSTVELLYGMLVRKDRSVLGDDPMGHSPLHRAVVALLTELTANINSPDRH